MTLDKRVVGACSGVGLINNALIKIKILSDKSPSIAVNNQAAIYQNIAYPQSNKALIFKSAPAF